MSDTTYDFEKMEFGEIITAPLTACVDAQAQAASATAEYIQNMGFLYDDQEKVYKPVTFSFRYQTDEGMKRFTIPLISVVPVPYLQIHDVNLFFSTDLSVKDGQLSGKVSSGKSTRSQESDKEVKTSDLRLNVNIKASTSDMPIGIIKLLQTMQHHITVKEIE